MRIRLGLGVGLVLAAIGWLLYSPSPHARAQSQPDAIDRVYVANSGSNNVSVLEVEPSRVRMLKTIDVGTGPNGLAASSPNAPEKHIYVANFNSNTVTVIDDRTLLQADLLQVGQGPVGVATSSDGNFVYVSNFNDDTVSVIDLVNSPNRVVQNIRVGGSPNGIAVSLEPRVIVANNRSNSITSLFYDRQEQELEKAHKIAAIEIRVGSRPLGVAFNRVKLDAGEPTAILRTYVANSGESSVSVLFGNSRGSIPVGRNPTGLALGPLASPDGSRTLYVTNFGSNTVSVVTIPKTQIPNRVDEKETATVRVGRGPTGIAVNPTGTRIFVTNFTDNTVTVINATTLQVFATVSVGQRPIGIAVAP